ncbi:MAG: hypothetical protein WCX74_03220 [Candidatus Paceibacterota bacterium]
MEKSFEGGENENITGKKVHLDWDEIRKGVLGSGEEKNPINLTIPSESAIINKKEVVEEEDSLEREGFSRPSSLPEIVIDLNEEDAGALNQPELSENLTGKRENFNWKEIMTGPLEKKQADEEAEKEYWAEIQKRAQKEAENIKEKEGDETPPPKPAPIKPESPETNPDDAEKLQKEEEERKRLEELKRREEEKERERLHKEEQEKLREEKKKRLDEVVVAINEKKQKIGEFSTLDSLRAAKREEKEKLLKELEALEKERGEIEKELGITSENPPKKEKSWLERQKERVYSFLERKKTENTEETENLSPEKKKLREKLVALAKNRKVQAAVVGSALLGISIAVPPVGGAAWLSGGLFSGFLPVEFGIPLKVLGGAASGAILKKVIEAKRAKEQRKSGEVRMNENEHFEYNSKIEGQQKKTFEAFGAVKAAQESLESIQNSPDLEGKEERIKEAQSKLDKASLEYLEEYNILTKMIYESIKKEAPKKTLTEKEKIDLINTADNLEKFYEAIMQLESNENAKKVIDDIQVIRKVIRDQYSKKSERNAFVDSITAKSIKSEGAANPEIPEIYNEKINELLKKEIETIPDTENAEVKQIGGESEGKGNKNKEEGGEDNQGSEEKDNKQGNDQKNKEVAPSFKATTIADFCEEIKASGEKDSIDIVKKIEKIEEDYEKGKDISPLLIEFPDQYLPRLTDLLVAKKNQTHDKKEKQNNSDVRNFEELFKNPDLSVNEKDIIQKIIIGQEKIGSLDESLQKTVSKLIEIESEKLEKATTLEDLYDAVGEVCASVNLRGKLNGFGHVEIIGSMKKYLHPDPRTSREEALEQIPEVYGIRKKFFQIVAENNLIGIDTKSGPTKDQIEANPKIVVEKGNEKPVSERIQEIVKKDEEMKEIEKEIAGADSMEELIKACSRMPDSKTIKVSTLINTLDDIDVYAYPSDSETSRDFLDKTLQEIPEEHDIREAVSRIVRQKNIT